MTPNEAQAAFDAAPEVPLSDERIRDIVAYATAPPDPKASEQEIDMERKVKISVTTDQGVLLDLITITIPANLTTLHIVPTKPNGEVFGSVAELALGMPRNKIVK